MPPGILFLIKSGVNEEIFLKIFFDNNDILFNKNKIIIYYAWYFFQIKQIFFGIL